MDIIERYIGAYIVECLTGIPGSNDGYYSILAQSRSTTKHPMLKKVLDITRGHEPRDPDIKNKVREFAINYLRTKYPTVTFPGTGGYNSTLE
jgi:hypothetical protein